MPIGLTAFAQSLWSGLPYEKKIDAPSDALIFATRNLIENPSAEVDASGAVGLTRVAAPVGFGVGGWCYQLNSATGGTAVAATIGAAAGSPLFSPGDRVNFRLRCRITSDAAAQISNLQIQANWYDAGGGTISTVTLNAGPNPIAATGTPVPLNVNFNLSGWAIAPDGAVRAAIRFRIGKNADATVVTAVADAAMMTVGPDFFDYFDGSTHENGFPLRTVWDGTANNSTSTLYNVVRTFQNTIVETALPGSMKSQPPGLEAIMEYNQLYFHDRLVVDKFRVLSLDGVQGADIRDNREANPSDHGETPFDNYLGGRTILITGRVEAHNIGKLRDMQQGLRTAFYSMQERPLIFHVGDPQRDVQIYCRMIDKISMREEQTNDRPHREFQITLRASDPRFRSVVDRVHSQIFGLLDDNSAGTVTQWTVSSGAAPTSSAGVLNVGTGTIRYIRNDLGYSPIDNQQTIKITTPATITTGDFVGVILKYIDSSNYTYARFEAASATTGLVRLVKIVGGAGTTLATTGTFAIAANTSYWLQSSTLANALASRAFTTDPSGGGGTPLSTLLSYNLTAGAEQTAFGTGVMGGTGLFATTVNQYKVDDYRVEPLSLNHQIITPTNQGNFLALPKIKVYGPMTGVTIRNETLMPDESTTRALVISGSIPAGRYYEYDALRGTLVDDLGANKFSQLDITTKQLQLRDGVNNLTVVATSASGITPQVVCTYQDTWI